MQNDEMTFRLKHSFHIAYNITKEVGLIVLARNSAQKKSRNNNFFRLMKFAISKILKAL